MKAWKAVLLSLVFNLILYGVFAIVIRLHMTQQAYQFYELKAYERSLKEEELRLRAELARALSPSHMSLENFREPQSNQVVKIP